MFPSKRPEDQRSTDWNGTQNIMETKHDGISSQQGNSYCTFAFIYNIRVPFQFSLSDICIVAIAQLYPIPIISLTNQGRKTTRIPGIWAVPRPFEENPVTQWNMWFPH